MAAKSIGIAMSQLVILGNGFDLACDLMSSFSSFLGWRQKQLDVRADAYDFSNPNLNAFDIVLNEHNGDVRLWNDVESAMQALFMGQANEDSGLDALYNRPGVHTIDLSSNQHQSTDEPNHPLYQYAKTRLQADTIIKRERLVDFLRSELTRYEKNFREYLLQEIDGHGRSYTSKAKNLLRSIVDDNVLGEEYWTRNGAVLSFNYTTPFTDCDVFWQTLSFYNIHGTLEDDNIIFGIDGKDVSDNDLGLPFTKTYRLLSMDPIGYRSLVHPPTDEYHVPTSCIKIYGHSLARADYSYFQTLFDAVSLYNGTAALVFYYSPHGEGGEQEKDRRTREDLYRRIMHLLISYGKTFDNKDHGKNLVHKLLLEGRLIIRRVPSGSD